MKKNKKGFTLIEIIVVLVILAILAAATIPSMLGFVKEANQKAYIADARTAYLAAQMIATEKYAANPGDATKSTPLSAEILKYLDTDQGVTKVVSGIKMDVKNPGKVLEVTVAYTKNQKTTKITISAGNNVVIS